MNPDTAHREPDPHGYLIEDVYEGDQLVALRLVRLHDRAEVGVFDSREELDAAVRTDDSTPNI